MASQWTMAHADESVIYCRLGALSGGVKGRGLYRNLVRWSKFELLIWCERFWHGDDGVPSIRKAVAAL